MSFKEFIRDNLPFHTLFLPIYRFFKHKWYYFFGRPYIFAETSKAKIRRLRENFFEKYCRGKGLDIGYGGDKLIPGIDVWDFEHGDAQYLKGIPDGKYDFVYSSHVLEHVENAEITLKNWFRVLKKGGYLLIYIPHRDLYEKKKTLPSRFNPDHKRFFIIDNDELPDTLGVLPLIKRTLKNFEIIYCKKCNEGHTITDPEQHSDGEFSIEIVIRKTN